MGACMRQGGGVGLFRSVVGYEFNRAQTGQVRDSQMNLSIIRVSSGLWR